MLKSAVVEEKKFKHSPRVGADNPLGPKFWCQQESLITMVICCMFKKNLFNFWLYTHLFMIQYMYIAAGQGQTTPGDKILMSTETSCHFGHLLQVSKKSLWSLILYNFFHDFIHVYNPGAGADNPLGMKFWCQQVHLVTSVICCKFKKISLKSDFIRFFFMILYMYIATGQGQTAPRGQKFAVNRNVLSLHSFVASLKKYL